MSQQQRLQSCWVVWAEVTVVNSVQDKVFFPEIWYLNVSGHLKFANEASNWIAVNWTLQSQTKACITKSSCEICGSLG
jgi:hypothetical protein